MYKYSYQIPDGMGDPITYLAKSDPYIVFYDQSMHEPDQVEFLNVSVWDINRHCNQKYWRMIPQSETPEVEPTLDSLWSMNINRYINTRQFYKCKLRLNMHSGKQDFGVNYFDTYSPVVTLF